MTKKTRRALIAGGAAALAIGGLAVARTRARKTARTPEGLPGMDQGYDEVQHDEYIGLGTVRPRPIELE